MVLASADWVARGLSAAGLLSLGWSIYTWRRTNRVWLRVRSTYEANGVPPAARSLLLSVTNRSSSTVSVSKVFREEQHKQGGRRGGRWVTNAIDHDLEPDPELSWHSPSQFPGSIPRSDTRQFLGQDDIAQRAGSRMRWRYRVVLTDGQWSSSRRSLRDRSGRLTRGWPRSWYRLKV